MPSERPGALVVYWDASAILSVLVEDAHTEAARRVAGISGHHLLSSLAFAEASAVLSRLGREGKASREALTEASRALRRGPWRWLAAGPDAAVCAELAARHALRGADLWHLAAAATLRDDLPELRLLTYDFTLERAALAEDLAFSGPRLEAT